MEKDGERKTSKDSNRQPKTAKDSLPGPLPRLAVVDDQSGIVRRELFGSLEEPRAEQQGHHEARPENFEAFEAFVEDPLKTL